MKNRIFLEIVLAFIYFRDPSLLEEKIKPFDWTFSTDYRGTASDGFVVTETEERIDFDRLKEKEAILFYQDLMLYEDELHDNGIASCTVKIVSLNIVILISVC